MNNINLSIMIGLSAIGLIIQCLFIYVESKKDYVKAVILKGSASMCFLGVGITAFIFSINKTFATYILVGLILGVIGDIMLNLRFIIKNKSNIVFLGGTASFLLGHIFYIVALFTLASIKFIYAPIIVAIAITAIVAYFIFSKLSVEKKMKIFGVVYILIVSLFMSVANYNLIISVSNASILLAVGSILFFSSDVILIFNSFGPNPKLCLRTSNLLLYFAGQLLIGFALLFI